MLGVSLLMQNLSRADVMELLPEHIARLTRNLLEHVYARNGRKGERRSRLRVLNVVNYGKIFVTRHSAPLSIITLVR